METYKEMKQRHQDMVNAFPIGFAFSKEQFEEAKEKLGVTSNDDLVSIGYGGFIRKTDKNAFLEMYKQINKEDEDFKKNDGNVVDMFVYEMGNHEYFYSYDRREVCEGCGIPYSEFMNDERYSELFSKAESIYFKKCEENCCSNCLI